MTSAQKGGGVKKHPKFVDMDIHYINFTDRGGRGSKFNYYVDVTYGSPEHDHLFSSLSTFKFQP